MKTVKQLVIAGLSLFMSITAIAQQVPDEMRHEMKRKAHMKQVEAMKVGFITKRLDMDAETAQKFWPVYNEYESEMKALRESHKNAMKDAHENWKDQSDKKKDELLQSRFEMEAKELELKKAYHEQFKKVLSIDQTAKLYHSQEEFKKHLIEELRERHKEAKPMKEGVKHHQHD